MQSKPHSCEDHAIHGALARRFHGVPIKECMACGRWKPEGGLLNYDWQPANTLLAYRRGNYLPTAKDLCKCGQPHDGWPGKDGGWLCQMCWEADCSEAWWEMWKQEE